MRWLHLIALTVPLALCAPLSAHAANGPTEEQLEAAKEHFAKGRELYEKGDKKGAVEEFKLAYKLSKNALLLYNVGLVYDELGDKSLSLHYYEKFLKEAPDNDKTKANKKLAQERVSVLRKELTSEDDPIAAEPKPAEPKPVPKPVKPAKPSVTEFTHTIIDEAPPGKPIDVGAYIPADTGWKLTLYYRVQGQDEFVAVQMKTRFDELVGRIPAEAVKGQSIQYYIQVKDSGGKQVAQSGSPASPNIVFLEPKAKAHYYLDEGGSAADAEAPPVEDDTTAGGGALDDEDPFADQRPYRGDDDEPGIGGGGGGGSGPSDKGGTDWVKWGTTGGAVALLGASAFFFVTARNYGKAVEDESESCGVPPCQQFDDYVADLESRGKAFSLYSNVALGVGVATAGVAAYIWYKDAKKPKSKKPKTGDAEEARRGGLRVVGAPMVGPGVVGGAAVIEF